MSAFAGSPIGCRIDDAHSPQSGYVDLLEAGVQPARPIGSTEQEWTAIEAPVALTVNGISQAVMLATPLNLQDFALGFATSEGWITHPSELLDVEALQTSKGIELALRLQASCEYRLKQRRRLLAGRTGCGLCGLESLAQLDAIEPGPVFPPAVHAGALSRAFSSLAGVQPLNRRCGGLHVAAWCTLDGEILLAREDVGRHNALDKLVGARLHRMQRDVEDGFVLMSSRASHELVHKAAMAGVGMLSCVSAPTSMAIATAERFGVHLWAFVRGDRATRYA